jgi:hypothetical protein
VKTSLIDPGSGEFALSWLVLDNSKTFGSTTGPARLIAHAYRCFMPVESRFNVNG